MLPAQSVRILSLVPADASDIRDTSAETFSDIDRRAFRASLFSIVGAVLFVVAGLLALLTAVRLLRRYRTPVAAAERPISDAAILRGAGAELRSVRRERENGGWTPELAGRALAALRIPATYLMGRKVGVAALAAPQPAAPPSATPESPVFNPQSGGLLLRTGWPKRKTLAVSGAVTPQTVSRGRAETGTSAKRGAILDQLSTALTTFTTAQYGCAGATMDDGALDQALATAFELLKRVRLEQTWIMTLTMCHRSCRLLHQSSGCARLRARPTIWLAGDPTRFEHRARPIKPADSVPLLGVSVVRPPEGRAGETVWGARK